MDVRKEREIMNLDFGKYYEAPGTPTAKAMADLHRHDDVVNDVQKRQDDVVNDAVKFTEKEEIAVKALIRNPRLSAARLADILGIKHRQAQRIIASLKKKAGLKRRGADKNGEWYFEGTAKCPRRS